MTHARRNSGNRPDGRRDATMILPTYRLTSSTGACGDVAARANRVRYEGGSHWGLTLVQKLRTSEPRATVLSQPQSSRQVSIRFCGKAASTGAAWQGNRHAVGLCVPPA
jgi:hypothetical protein